MNDAHPDTFEGDPTSTGAAAAYALLACAFVLGLIIGGSVVATAGGLW